ncbi:oxidoreductase [Leptolyngbya sp. 'hensonii']|uniref:2Fe-2S iron-sulfur cluster-binding protein n=1 Tax=Leptolyngbya sp. 'hensonii' TaxID=1922337 RepID=UPI00094FA93E|nr:2Fe-2S iron-sulfur cluster-binding protein [Leptolyngbya sp. 'hensonii']OLP18431.1 oxidoreductase [Leptolyngbya sp. 'hensonii']
MLESLAKIQNPLIRSATAAITVCSVMTFAAAITIGIAKPKTDDAFRSGLTASLIGTGVGALFGLVYRQRQGAKTQTGPATQLDGKQPWQDWRNFVVAEKVKESEEITSFYLKPEDGGMIPHFQPGQFLTIKLEIPGQPRPVIRTYSLSDYCNTCMHYRLSIKREPAPKGLDVLPGVASNFMHDQIQVGSVIQAKPPAGKFILDVYKSLPVVLISNGVGITPMISMAKACARMNPDRPLWFLHGARDGRFHAFREEVQAIAQQNPTLQVHYCYSRPRPEDAGHYQSEGYVDVALLQKLVTPNAEFFLCGSPPFMQSLRDGLKAWGVPEEQVFFEAFTKAPAAASPPAIEPQGASAEVVFAQSGQTLTWRESDGTLLEFAEANNINPPYSCRAGICGTCICKLQAGEVTYREAPTAAIEAGSVLICISQPKSERVVLDI